MGARLPEYNNIAPTYPQPLNITNYLATTVPETTTNITQWIIDKTALTWFSKPGDIILVILLSHACILQSLPCVTADGPEFNVLSHNISIWKERR